MALKRLVYFVFFLTYVSPAVQIIVGYGQHDTSSRKLLKRDYKPDEFEIPSDSRHQFLADKIMRAFENSATVLTCPISTFSCGNSDPNSTYTSESLGSCALVASGQSILNYEYGNEIDSADTVLRIGFGPVKKYRKSVGSRTDILFVRTPGHALLDFNKSVKNDYTARSFSMRDHLPTKFFLTLPSSCQRSKFHGRSILKLKLLSHTKCNKAPSCDSIDDAESRFKYWYEGFSSEDEFSASAREFFVDLQKFRKKSDEYSKKSEIVFTHGFELILAMLHSNLCKTITTYGFSKFPTYHYFDSRTRKNGRRVRPGHVMGMEHFILDQLQRKGLPIFLKASE